jgi:antitoxin MazE
MRVHLVRIGNSRGIRIPKAVIDELGLDGELELVIRDGKLVLSQVREPREGWDRAFAAMASRGDDRLVHGEQVQASSWDQEEWEW